MSEKLFIWNCYHFNGLRNLKVSVCLGSGGDWALFAWSKSRYSCDCEEFSVENVNYSENWVVFRSIHSFVRQVVVFMPLTKLN